MTFSERLTIDLGGDRGELVLQYCGRGHTEGDIVAWLPQQRILFAGDLVEAQAALYTGDAFHTRLVDRDAGPRSGEFEAEAVVGGRGVVPAGGTPSRPPSRRPATSCGHAPRGRRGPRRRWDAAGRLRGDAHGARAAVRRAGRSSSTACRSTCQRLWDELDGIERPRIWTARARPRGLGPAAEHDVSRARCRHRQRPGRADDGVAAGAAGGCRSSLLDARPAATASAPGPSASSGTCSTSGTSVGAGERIAAEGAHLDHRPYLLRRRRAARVRLRQDPGRSPCPPFVNLSQSPHRDRFSTSCIARQPLIDVRWGHEVVDLRQDDDGVSVTCAAGGLDSAVGLARRRLRGCPRGAAARDARGALRRRELRGPVPRSATSAPTCPAGRRNGASTSTRRGTRPGRCSSTRAPVRSSASTGRCRPTSTSRPRRRRRRSTHAFGRSSAPPLRDACGGPSTGSTAARGPDARSGGCCWRATPRT